MPRVALVTGGAGGFGTAIAERLREDRLDVIAADLPELDVADHASVDGFVSGAVERHGRLDVLVNNAGVAGPTAPVETYPVEEWRRVVEVNLTGTFLYAALHSADAGARLWADRQHRVDRGQEATPTCRPTRPRRPA